MRAACYILLALLVLTLEGPDRATLEQALGEMRAATKERWQPAAGEQFWHRENSGLLDGVPDADIDLDTALLHSKRCWEPVTVAVLDGGFVLGRRELRERWVQGWDLLDGDADPYVPDPSDRGMRHGTQVATLVADVAAAPLITVMPVRIMDEAGGDGDILARGIRWATDAGADVINLSAGMVAFRTTAKRIAEAREAVRYAVERGVFVAVAAGNDGYDNRRGGEFAFHPGADAAGIEGAVSVAASDAADRLWAGSNTGAEIAAPGVTVTTAGYAHGDLQNVSGTSMATPLVAGAAAQALACRPELTPAELERLVIETADPLRGPGARSVGGRLNAGRLIRALG